MTDENTPETPQTIPSARASNFSHVTTVGNKCVDQLKKVTDQGPEKIVQVIRQTMPELLMAAIEVTFEKAKLWTVIDRDENLSFYQKLEVDKWMAPGDLNAEELKKATVSNKS